jgi:hypothetical protein
LKTEDTSSKNLWALSTFAAAIGDGAPGFAVDDHESFRRQEFLFASLNLLLIGALLALQALSKYVRGKPTAAVVIVLAIGFAIQAAHIILASHPGRYKFPRQTAVPHLVVTQLQHHTGADAHFVDDQGRHRLLALMLLPILEAAFRLDLRATLTVVMLARYNHLHGRLWHEIR